MRACRILSELPALTSLDLGVAEDEWEETLEPSEKFCPQELRSCRLACRHAVGYWLCCTTAPKIQELTCTKAEPQRMRNISACWFRVLHNKVPLLACTDDDLTKQAAELMDGGAHSTPFLELSISEGVTAAALASFLRAARVDDLRMARWCPDEFYRDEWYESAQCQEKYTDSDRARARFIASFRASELTMAHVDALVAAAPQRLALDLKGQAAFDDEAFERLVTGLPFLQEIRLKDATLLTTAAAQLLVQHSTSLQNARMCNIPGIGVEGCRALIDSGHVKSVYVLGAMSTSDKGMLRKYATGMGCEFVALIKWCW
jgi:hypothetical protein